MTPCRNRTKESKTQRREKGIEDSEATKMEVDQKEVFAGKLELITNRKMPSDGYSGEALVGKSFSRLKWHKTLLPSKTSRNT